MLVESIMSARFSRACHALVLSLSLLAAAACSKESSAPSSGTPAAEKADQKESGHAPAGVKPGSHEDW